jgi:biotin synthase-related radical SAM superfamily protein
MGEERPKKVRVSIGSAVVLGLLDARLDAEPTTLYVLTYNAGGCRAACAFCPQSRVGEGRADMLSRVVWPAFRTSDVIPRIEGAFAQGKVGRICVQALNYPKVQDDLVCLARQIHSRCDIPISVSCQPLSRAGMLSLAEAGIDRVSIAVDAVTKDLFDNVKGRLIGGPYTWEGHFEALEEAVKIFGRNRVTTHLIAGLGETEDEFVSMIQKCVDLGVYPALFAFTPIRGTMMADHPRPSLDYYRRAQLAHCLVTRGSARYEDMKFMDNRLAEFGLSRDELIQIIRTGEPFRTSGCPDCNRPYYNERPGGPIYNYPRKPTSAEVAEAEKILGF